jgi:LmbE family N-acetylglucosaminyl deacetylase
LHGDADDYKEALSIGFGQFKHSSTLTTAKLMFISKLTHKFHQKRKYLYLQWQRTVYTPGVFRWLLLKSRPMTLSLKPTVVFAPHQDDETLGCGGLIALKQEQEIPTWVVFLTDGKASHPKHPCIKPQEMIQIRKKEAITALATLGLESSRLYFLDQPDGGLFKLSSVDRQSLILQLVDLLHRLCPEEVYVPYREDVNTDHKATFELVQAAVKESKIQVELLQYPVWSLWKPEFLDFRSTELKNTYRLSLHHGQKKKRQALEAYRSQYLPIPPETKSLLPTGFLEHLSSPYEIFFRPDAKES